MTQLLGKPVLLRKPTRQWPAERFQHPTRIIVAAFALAIAAGTALLSLPIATESGRRTDSVDALFTATSAVCVTGLATVDTGTHWSLFGEVVILALIQAGGLGIMTLATLVVTLLNRRLGLRGRLLAQVETKALTLHDIRRVVRNIVLFSLATETVVALVLTGRFAVTYDQSLGHAAYHGIFHSISTFNNAGFSLNPTNLIRYAADPVVSIAIAVAVIVGGLGFPVLFELWRQWRRPKRWSVMTRLTLSLTVALLTVGTLVVLACEATNAKTLGPLSGPAKLLAAFFHAAMTRTAGFNSLDMAALRPETLFASDLLMFIGGGSAGTAGGLKVTTFGVLAAMVWAELRGDRTVDVGRRRVPMSTQRQALTLVLLGIGTVTASTVFLLNLTRHSLDVVLFEAVSAFATVGLSVGITPTLPTAGHLLLIALMFIGRTGPLTIAAAFALRERTARYEQPEQHTLVG